MPLAFGQNLTILSINMEDKTVTLGDDVGSQYHLDMQPGDEPLYGSVAEEEDEEDTDTDTVSDAQLEELIAEEADEEQKPKLATFQQLPSMVREALTKLVNYDYEEEQANYEQETKDTCEEGEVLADHIFYDLDLLKDWIGEGE